MNADTVVTLGDFQFASTEVPQSISFGGDQSLIVNRLQGGARVIDAMGPDPLPLQWGGWFTGENALDRALYLDGLRKAGGPLDLTWDQLYFRVVIRSLQCEFQRFYQLPYSIVCEVLEDRTSPVTSIAAPSADSAIADDVDAGQSMIDKLGISSLSTAYATIKSAINQVSSFAQATQAQINAVLQPLQAFRQQINTLLASASNTIQNVTTVGGVLPNNPLARNTAALSSQIAAVSQSQYLARLDTLMGRVGSNIANVSSSTRVVTVAGGDLMHIANQEYGDWTGWTNIAKANKLTDPKITGVKTLVIPPQLPKSGGVLIG